MINNVSFQGFATIDHTTPNNNQLKLNNAIKSPANKTAIKNDLPADVQLLFYSQEATKEQNVKGSREITFFTQYVAEFFNGEEKIGEVVSGVGADQGPKRLENFVKKAVNECKAKLDKTEENQSTLDQIKSNNGIVI